MINFISTQINNIKQLIENTFHPDLQSKKIIEQDQEILFQKFQELISLYSELIRLKNNNITNNHYFTNKFKEKCLSVYDGEDLQYQKDVKFLFKQEINYKIEEIEKKLKKEFCFDKKFFLEKLKNINDKQILFGLMALSYEDKNQIKFNKYGNIIKSDFQALITSKYSQTIDFYKIQNKIDNVFTERCDNLAIQSAQNQHSMNSIKNFLKNEKKLLKAHIRSRISNMMTEQSKKNTTLTQNTTIHHNHCGISD